MSKKSLKGIEEKLFKILWRIQLFEKQILDASHKKIENVRETSLEELHLRKISKSMHLRELSIGSV